MTIYRGRLSTSTAKYKEYRNETLQGLGQCHAMTKIQLAGSRVIALGAATKDLGMPNLRWFEGNMLFNDVCQSL